MVGDAWRRSALAVLGRLPLHLLSRVAGRLAEVELPRRLRRPLLGGFARLVGVELGEVPLPLESYPSLQAFFTRSLAPGARPIDPRPDSVLAPCDGRVGAFGTVEEGRLLQVKGRSYGLAELLGDPDEAKALEGGRFATFYLAPRDYHRFHAPCSGRVVALRYLPGELWPVNRLGVEGVEALFARNERLVAHFELEAGGPAGGGGRFAVAAVGATLVGCVRVGFDDLRTGGGGPVLRRYEPGVPVARGEEWGHFEFGSTLVVVAGPGLLEWELPGEGAPVRMGRRVGRLFVPSPARGERAGHGADGCAGGRREEEGRCAHPQPR